MQPEPTNYSCSQQDLYSVLNTLWDNYAKDIADFTAYKASYTAQKGLDARIAVADAKKLPDDQARTGLSEQLRIKVEKAADTLIGNFLQAKGYINGVFTEEFRKANYEMAGQNYYRGATRNDWESVSGMGTSLENYVTDNNDLLQDAGKNMPADFINTVSASVSSFENLYGEFKTSSETSVPTATKIKANNACYTTAREMMDDAQTIYRKKHEYAERYIFDRILEMINSKTAGIKGKILHGDTNEGLPNAEIKFQQEGKPEIKIMSDAEGNYEKTLPSGDYKITVSKSPEFESFTEVIVVKHGTVSTRDFPLQVAIKEEGTQ